MLATTHIVAMHVGRPRWPWWQSQVFCTLMKCLCLVHEPWYVYTGIEAKDQDWYLWTV